ncbi:MAG: MBOAT family protein [Planctomycetes bacterium]|nr:MBOAT family protein [Planctomycetota bacterium]
MVFSSAVFLYLFLPAFLLAYALSPRALKALTISAFSFVFYGWWRPDFVLLMLASSVIDYWLGGRIARQRAAGTGNGRRELVLSMVANLGLLGYFKYANFGVDTARTLLQACGFAGDFGWTAVVLPVGISFYTFQTMSYTIDLYRGEVRPASSFIDFLCYVSMFPQLVAGPIVRYAVVEHELRTREHTWYGFYQGVLFLQTGIAKKVLLADTISGIADRAFAVPDAQGLGLLDAWLGITAYAFQIYFDFSGYSDMAIGLGLMMGFKFPFNFDSPYHSQSITEFWRRWHMSLSNWLRDYLYIALGGNRKGPVRTYVNLALTMLLGGLWHGAAWNFVAWGGYQGFWLVIERLAGKRPWYGVAPTAVRVAITFVLALFGWVLFRATGLGHAIQYAGAMLGLGPAGAPTNVAALTTPLAWTGLLAAAAITWTLPSSQRLAARAHPLWVLLLQPCFLAALLHLHYQDNVPFLYFQF